MVTDNHAPAWTAPTQTSATRDSHNDGAQPAKPMKPRLSLGDRLWKMFVWGAMAFFLFNVLLLIATVAVNSVATRWFGTLLPAGFTLHWYAQAWSDFQLASVLWVTVEVVGAVVLLSIALGVPAAYALPACNFAASVSRCSCSCCR